MQQPTERLLCLCDVMERTGFKRTFIYGQAQKGLFPKRVKIGPRAARWRESEIREWISQQGVEGGK